MLREKAEWVRAIEERLYVAKIKLRRKASTPGEVRQLNRNLAIARAATAEQLAPLFAERDAKNRERLKKYEARFGWRVAARTAAEDLVRWGHVEAADRLDAEVVPIRDDGRQIGCCVPYRFRFVTQAGLVRQHDGYIMLYDSGDGLLMRPSEVDVDGVSIQTPFNYDDDLRPWVLDVYDGKVRVLRKGDS